MDETFRADELCFFRYGRTKPCCACSGGFTTSRCAQLVLGRNILPPGANPKLLLHGVFSWTIGTLLKAHLVEQVSGSIRDFEAFFLLRWRTVDVLCFRPWRPSWRSDTTLLLPANAVCIENLKCSAKKNRIRKVTGLTALDSWPSKCYLRSSPLDIQSYFLSWFQSAKTCLVGRMDIVSESCMIAVLFWQ